MSKVITFIFGGILVFFGLDSLFGGFFLGLVGLNLPEYMMFIVGGMGAIILLTPIIKIGVMSDSFYWIRRWVFGGFLVLSGLGTILSGYFGMAIFDGVSYGTITAAIAYLLIGGIYILSVVKGGKYAAMKVGSY
jgi:hypothetical protein